MSTPTFWVAGSRKEPLASSEVPDNDYRVEIEVDGVAMVRLLGPQDRLLSTIEGQYPGVDVLVRGNHITLSGEPGPVDAAKALVDEQIGRAHV